MPPDLLPLDARAHSPVLAELVVDPTVARAVDAGVLASRLPRSLAKALSDAA
jgi:hypothetical protein